MHSAVLFRAMRIARTLEILFELQRLLFAIIYRLNYAK